jgi:hypothetical protein
MKEFLIFKAFLADIYQTLSVGFFSNFSELMVGDRAKIFHAKSQLKITSTKSVA